MMQLLPTVIGAYVELNFVLGWATVLDPRVMRCVPVRDAFSAITTEEARLVGGLGPVGMVDARLEDDILIALYERAFGG